MTPRNVDTVRFIAQSRWEGFTPDERRLIQGDHREGYSYDLYRDAWTHWIVVPDGDRRVDKIVSFPSSEVSQQESLAVSTAPEERHIRRS